MKFLGSILLKIQYTYYIYIYMCTLRIPQLSTRRIESKKREKGREEFIIRVRERGPKGRTTELGRPSTIVGFYYLVSIL
jgi:hypothetical protein